jgi:hypothetical protein
MESRGMEKLNLDLFEFFTTNYKPGTIGLVGTRDTIGLAIREAQRQMTANKTASLWSHCFIFGELRRDRRGPEGAVNRSPYIFESDIAASLLKPQLRNGAQENWVGKWCKDTVAHAAVVDLGLSDEQTDIILATALQLIDEQILYPIQELFGTWLAITTKKQWLPNPFNDPHAMYCSTFVRYCYKEAGKDFLGNDVSLSNTTPEDIVQAGTRAGKLETYRPKH